MIIEDEEANANRLKRMVTGLRSNYLILEVLSSIEKSVDWLSNNEHPDLLFMDIRLSDGVSFEIFNLIDIKCPVIFTTAYDEFALRAFKHNSIDYLLKPIEEDELKFALEKFENQQQKISNKFDFPREILDMMLQKEYRVRFLVTYKDGFKQVSVSNISYFMSEYGSTFSVTFDGEKHLVSHTLESLEEQLDPKEFFRANRQYIVNVKSITQVHNYFNSKLKLDIKQCKEGVFISRLKATLFKEWLDS
ncbi:LytR/AlgR family response regulator transcription factor [Penaeicola halotolerans]|uniref:LytR/AlgR family response regulator transcription factor n=1 Tax=Penaeicola halotolerans TaxID=2793196 RepID=UPI0021CE9072|nr:LytTR family DNA-binding domain-containing protein [Penaeicola halotolerans]